MKELFKFPLDLQFFAEGANSGAEEGDVNTNSDETDKPQTFTQADVDRAVTKAVQTATANANNKAQASISQAVQEALEEERRVAALTEEQRQEEARKAAQKAFEKKEQELNKKILRVDVGNLLVTEGLEKEFLDFVIGDDLETSQTNINTLKGLIDARVQEGIKQVITKPGVPSKPKNTRMTKEEILAIKNTVERQKAIADNIELFK
ncbi:DUF4355 domain-containing protein [Erysipelothrix urinaevulpis]|uniref:DUF4355 domain-containing protein n=1 Tax=Erysipelothrix urinaevulpis TaxID=2683717 RepID=UPI001358DAAF|nr:DUF4355 domain-containing protein [Erysipelothrix urinaevulpis]